MTGSGNDFVFVDGRSAPAGFWTPTRIREICARQTGVGADGFCMLEPGSSALAVRLHYFNRDGHRAELCGNASLCATRLASWIELGPAEGLVLETDAGLIRGRYLPGPGERAEISLGDVSRLSQPPIELMADEMTAHFVRVGVPHLVIAVTNLTAVDVPGRGRELRYDPALAPDGANVDFVGCTPDGWAMRTYERGVEDETLACGTGAVAVATVLAATRSQALPIPITTRSGRALEVARDSNGSGGLYNVRLLGEGRLAFRAILGS
ncbi:MAG: diaminopimelate epimerase [Gemmatimonadetes bacterium]|nr:diaminopimelate epimerase [Gemmatimonadota bacterium]